MALLEGHMAQNFCKPFGQVAEAAVRDRGSYLRPLHPLDAEKTKRFQSVAAKQQAQ
jgi:hypothetical protein